MKATTIFPFFKNGQHTMPNFVSGEPTPDAKESKVFNNQIYSTLVLEVKGDNLTTAFPISVVGYIDSESDPSEITLSGVNLSDVQPVEDIEAAGLYSFHVTGINHIKVKVNAATSDATITGSFVE